MNFQKWGGGWGGGGGGLFYNFPGRLVKIKKITQNRVRRVPPTP